MSEKWLLILDKHLKLILLGLFLLRCGYLEFNQISLAGDESYYWDWSRQLDWCYYSKPPMVAWLIALSSGFWGDNVFGVRFPAVILGTIFLGYFHATAMAFYGRRAAAIALLLVLATPNNVLANLIMTIDPPLNCFWMMSLYYLRRALFDQQNLAWFGAGCAGGLALLSKQVAIALPLLVLVFLLLDKTRYKRIHQEFLIYLLPIILAAVPILSWNQEHNWVMFTHSQSHFTSQVTHTLLASLGYVSELILYQFLLISPLLFIAAFTISAYSLRMFNALGAEEQFLVLMGPLLLIGVLLLSLAQKVQGNWPMPFYFTAFILLSGYWQHGNWQKFLKLGLWSGFGMILLTYVLPVLLSIVNLQNTVLDPTKRFNHWPQLVGDIQHARQQALPTTQHSFVLALSHRNLASQLAFYLPDHPKVFRYESSGEIKSQYEVWPGPLAFIGKNAIIVSDADNPVPEEIKAAFKKLTLVDEIPNPDHLNSAFYVYFAEQLLEWPNPLDYLQQKVF